MARSRTVNPGILVDEDLSALDFRARWLFLAMIVTADDDGRLKGSPRALKSVCMPSDDVLLGDVKADRDMLDAGGMIRVYQAADGKEYIQIRGWWKYQRVKYYTPSHLPEPPAGTLPAGFDRPRGEAETREEQARRRGKSLDDKTPAAGSHPHRQPRGHWDSAGSALETYRPGKLPVTGTLPGGDRESAGDLPVAGREPTDPVPDRERRGEERREDKHPCSTRSNADVEKLVGWWNGLADRHGLPRVRLDDLIASKARLPKAKARIREGILDRCPEIESAVAADAFYRGGGNRGWRLTLKHLIENDANFRELASKAQAGPAAQALPSRYDLVQATLYPHLRGQVHALVDGARVHVSVGPGIVAIMPELGQSGRDRNLTRELSERSERERVADSDLAAWVARVVQAEGVMS